MDVSLLLLLLFSLRAQMRTFSVKTQIHTVEGIEDLTASTCQFMTYIIEGEQHTFKVRQIKISITYKLHAIKISLEQR